MSTAERIDTDTSPGTVTASLAEWLAGLKPEDITPSAYTWSKHALLDWLGVTIAGAPEELVQILTRTYADDAGGCSLVGLGGRKATLEMAALINGTASHTLDYDDVNRRINGHPTVPVAPVALALGEHLGASGRDVLAAIAAGTEIECLIGQMAGPAHYEAGFHNTATLGTFGATATAAKLLGLDATGIRHAFGIAASEAAGLKANFGTMTKPLHAGRAAMNGMMAARLASQGFTANPDIFDCHLGFAEALLHGFTPGATSPNPPGYYAIEQTLFKYHAACYLTHAAMEAIGKLRAEHNLSLDDLKAMELHINPGLLTVCCIPAPHTGLEIKFSIRHCAAMALDGMNTAAPETYTDENARNARYNAGREKVTLVTTDAMDRMATKVVITTNDGRTLEAFHDAGIHEADVALQARKLRQKFNTLVPPLAGNARAAEMIELVEQLDTLTDINGLMAASR